MEVTEYFEASNIVKSGNGKNGHGWWNFSRRDQGFLLRSNFSCPDSKNSDAPTRFSLRTYEKMAVLLTHFPFGWEPAGQERIFKGPKPMTIPVASQYGSDADMQLTPEQFQLLGRISMSFLNGCLIGEQPNIEEYVQRGPVEMHGVIREALEGVMAPLASLSPNAAVPARQGPGLIWGD